MMSVLVRSIYGERLIMLTCEICGEELVLEEDMKTHLLLSHLENEMSCPLCSLSGVSYDELNFHMDTAHPEQHDTVQAHFTHGCCSPTGANRKLKQIRDLSRHSERETAPSHSSGDSCYMTKGGVSPETSLYGTIAQQSSDVAGTSPVVGEGLLTARTAPITPPAVTTKTTRTSQSSEQVRHCGDGTATSRIISEHSKAKQKRLSSPRKEKQFPCPMCSQVYNNCFMLEEHVELHLQEQNITEGAALGASSSASIPPSSHNLSGEKSYECPMCCLVCSDSSSLQEHVELHLEYGTATTCAVSPSSDLKLARQLQEAEDQRRREHEAKQEAVEFKKLQKQFGLDGSGGYRRQMEQTMEKAVSRGLMAPSDFHNSRADMMEALATGVDDGRTRTQGMLGALSEFYQREARDCVHVWLSAETDHFCSSEGDKGWGCGYRNFQMLLSSLHRMETFADCLPEKAVPSIPRVQSLIEGAWRVGLDPQGASHFNQRLQGTRAWVGATEIYSVLTSLGVRATIIDFHQPTGPADTHPRLFEWVKQYFSMSASRGTRLPPRLIQTSQPPLYLQHQGHSRTIVGVEQKRNGSLCLLVLDPGCSPAEARKLLSRDSAATAVRRIRKFPNNLKHKQYQVVAAKGTLSPEEKRICILNSRTLIVERIP